MASFAQQVIWTALPRPMDGRKLQVSVLASPRLTVGASAVSLKTFLVWMDWPSVIARAQFTVTFGAQRFKAEVISRPDSEIWRAIFGDKTIVRGREDADLSDKLPMSYRAAAMALRLRKTYVDVTSRWPNRPPTAADLRTPLDDFIRAPSGPGLLKTLSGPSAAGQLKELGKLADLAEFHAFQTPFLTDFNAPPSSKEGRDLIDGMDFHRLVATLGQHAMLLRQTGLVIDLALDGEPRPDEAPLAVDVKWSTGRDVETLPDGRTELMTRYDGRSFEAVADTNRIRGRRLDLANKRFSPMQVDVDGGIIKLTGAGASVVSHIDRIDPKQGKTARDEDPFGLPTLRSTGIVLTEAGRGEAVGDLLNRSANFESLLAAGRGVKVHAEDVTRGYHVDVEAGGQWRSLCRMAVGYNLADAREKLFDKDVEGLVQLAAGEAPPDAAPELGHIMRVTETLFHWDGWSLTAPRPGLALDKDGAPRRDAETGGLPVSVDASVAPKSLPRLRFGDTYRMRVRLADLAHNAERWDGKSDEGATKPITYRRFEPVAPPTPALVDGPGGVDAPEDGASLLRMVIRSHDADLTGPTGDEDLRMFLPPRASVEMAERHGVLDGADGRPRNDLYPLLESRDEDLPEVASTVEAKRRYPVADASMTTAPWLPDPAAHDTRAVITSDRPRQSPLTGAPNEFFETIPPAADWPNQRAWTLRLREDPDDTLAFVPTQATPYGVFDRCSWSAENRILDVALPKGETATLTLSAKFDGKGEPADLWGLAAWLKEDLGADAYEGLKQIINNGEHWAFTPDLKIELIHATQRPMVRPDPVITAATRSMGDTDAPLSLTAPCHAESTASLSLEGRWVEAFDDPGVDPGATWRSGVAFRHTLLDTASPNGAVTRNGTHTFGDTLYRRIRYRYIGASRFTEFFPPQIRNDPAATRLASPDVVVHVPNAAPPPPPVVSGMTPVFDWLRDTSGNHKASWRRFGVRVFLDRPWFTTGFGEMLAAVLPRQTAGANFERAASHVTLWSGDPIWKPRSGGFVNDVSPGLSAFPTRALPDDGPDPRWPAAFPTEERALAGGDPRYEALSLPDEDGGVIAEVDAAGHPVGWDVATGRYYADLMLDPGDVYQPFLRLAVARMHPISAEGCHLSPAVPLDMMQILPERLAVARRDGSNGWRVEVYGSLHGERDGDYDADRPWQNVMRAEVQRTSRTNPDELDWETVDDAAIADRPDAVSISHLVSVAMPGSYAGASLFPGKSGALFDAAAAFIARRPEPIFWRHVKAPGAGGGARGDDRWRIRITETERHSADRSTSQLADDPGANERVIFTETFEI